MGTSSRYERDRTVASTTGRVHAGGGRGGGSDDAAWSAGLRAFYARHHLVTDSSISPAAPSIADFPAISNLLARHARMATPFYSRTSAVSVFSIPIASAQRAATKAARASALACTATEAAERATEAANRAAAYADAAAASLDQLIDVQEANSAPSGNGDA